LPSPTSPLKHFCFFFANGRHETLVRVIFRVVFTVPELELVLSIPIHRYYAFHATHAYPPAMGVRVGAWVRITSKAIVTATSPPHIYVCVVRTYMLGSYNYRRVDSSTVDLASSS
jgi:hypothetical protein